MPNDPRIAVIADTHGNAWALEAVLEDIRARGVARIVNLGDNLNGPLDPARTARLLMKSGAVHVRGNGDREVVGAVGGEMGSAGFAKARCDQPTLDWLRSLPAIHQQDDWFACHGTPSSDTEYLTEVVLPSGAELAPAPMIQSRLPGISCRLVFCGHSHIPRMVRLDDGRMVVNPGSVGLPAYADLLPHPHAMESGSPHARYVLAELNGRGANIEFVSVRYDWEAAAACAESWGRDEWAIALRTGKVQ